MKKRVLLISPPSGMFIRDDRCQSNVESFMVSVVRPPHELMLMATIAAGCGHDVMIRDYAIERADQAAYEKDLRQFRPDVVVINATIPSLMADMHCAGLARQVDPATMVIVRCGMADQVVDELFSRFPSVDAVICGESDYALAEILDAADPATVRGIALRRNGGVIKTPARPFLDDLDQLPRVNRALIRNALYVRPDTGRPLALVEVSRGCPFACLFCLTQYAFGRKHHSRSVASVIAEIRECVERYGIRDFHLKSDLFTVSHAWVRALCDALAALPYRVRWFANSRVDSVDESLLAVMKKSGCFAVSFGVESGSETVLRQIDKRITVAQIERTFASCRNVGLRTYAYFILGFPWDTEETIRETMDLCARIRPTYVDYFLPYVFKGTPLYVFMREKGLIAEERTLDCYDPRSYVVSQAPTFTVSVERLAQLRRHALRRFYLRPQTVWRVLRSCENAGELFRTIMFGARAALKLSGWRA